MVGCSHQQVCCLMVEVEDQNCVIEKLKVLDLQIRKTKVKGQIQTIINAKGLQAPLPQGLIIYFSCKETW